MIKPYRPGGYIYEFVLHDSLNLQLDREVQVSLDGHFEYALVSSSFRFEDYELNQARYAARRRHCVPSPR